MCVSCCFGVVVVGFLGWGVGSFVFLVVGFWGGGVSGGGFIGFRTFLVCLGFFWGGLFVFVCVCVFLFYFFIIISLLLFCLIIH